MDTRPPLVVDNGTGVRLYFFIDAHPLTPAPNDSARSLSKLAMRDPTSQNMVRHPAIPSSDQS